MQVFIGLSEIILGIAFIVLTWRYNFFDRFSHIGDRQTHFIKAHFRRTGELLERSRETEGSRYLREHKWILQLVWSIGAFGIIALGMGALLNLREHMLLEIIIPIGMFLTILLLLSVGKPNKSNNKAEV